MHFDQTQEIPGAAHFFYTGPVTWNSLLFSVCHAWTVECQTTIKSPPLFHLFPAVFRSQFISVCVDKCDVGEFLNDLGL